MQWENANLIRIIIHLGKFLEPGLENRCALDDGILLLRHRILDKGFRAALSAGDWQNATWGG